MISSNNLGKWYMFLYYHNTIMVGFPPYFSKDHQLKLFKIYCLKKNEIPLFKLSINIKENYSN